MEPSVDEEIKQLLKKSGQMTTKQIKSRVKTGQKDSDSYVGNRLTRLVDRGEIVRIRRGEYGPAPEGQEEMLWRVIDERFGGDVTKVLEWLDSQEKAPPQEEGGADVTAKLAQIAKGDQTRLVGTEESPTHIMPGYAIGLPGQEQLFIDFLVTGNSDRAVLPMIEHRTKTD